MQTKFYLSMLLSLWFGVAFGDPKLGDLSFQGMDGKAHKLSSYQGKVVLIVNTASHCGYTDQYKALQSLYEQYNQKGLVIVGFPSQSFGQEFGKEAEVAQFCQRNYGVKFPMSKIVDVAGPKKHPIFKALIETSPGSLAGTEVQWNFEKFLIDRTGKLQARFQSAVRPDGPELKQALDKLLKG